MFGPDGTLGPTSPSAAAAVQALEVGGAPYVRWNATQALGRLGAEAGEEGAAALSRTLVHKESQGYLRWQATQSLAQLGGAAGHPAGGVLAQVLLQKKSGQPGAEEYVRCGAAAALASLGEAAGTEGAVALATALASDRSEVVRRRAAESLGELGTLAGEAGINALVDALGKDKDADVRLRACEALGQIGPRIGEAGSAALARALSIDEEIVVRLRAAASLGVLQDSVGEAGIKALLRSMCEDDRMAVRDQAKQSVERLRADCIGALDEVSGLTQAFMRGRAAHVLGHLGTMVEVEALEVLAVNLVCDPDSYLRRRIVEAVGKLGAAAGELGAAALHRAAAEDADVYVQWTASQILGGLGIGAGELGREHLARLMKEDVTRRCCRPPDREHTHVSVSMAEAPTEAVVPEVGEAIPAAASALISTPTEDVSPDAGAALVLQGLVEDVASSTGGPHLGLAAPYDHVDGTFVQPSVASLLEEEATGGLVQADVSSLRQMLVQMGHTDVDLAGIQYIIDEDFEGHSCFSIDAFKDIICAYDSRHGELLGEHFRQVDKKSSGFLNAQEVAALLKRMGITPETGVVPEVIWEVCGSRDAEVSFENYVKIHAIVNDRAGFTKKRYAKLQNIFRQHDQQGIGRISLKQLGSCLLSLGFAMGQPEVAELLAESLGKGVDEATQSNPEEFSVTVPQFLLIARATGEREARKLFQAFRRFDANEDGAINVVDATELPELLLDLGYVPPLPEVVREYMQQCGLGIRTELNFEDLCALLGELREAEGFSEAEIAEISSVFTSCDADASIGIAGLELEHAIRSLGYPVTLEQVQDVLDEFDIDDTGQLEHREFLHLMGRFRRAEMKKVISHVLQRAQQGRATVPAEGLPSILKDLGHEPLRNDSDVLRESMSGNENVHVDAWGLARLVGNYRAEQREQIRRWRGFTEAEVERCRVKFRECDPERTGTIKGKQLRGLMGQLVPNVRRNKTAYEQVAELLRRADSDASGSIDFDEFLELLRLVRDYSSKEKLLKERRAVQDTKFSRSELKEFRKIFHMFDKNDSGEMDFEELQQMVAVIVGRVATGHVGTRELRDILFMFDEDEQGFLDFPEFLHVIRHLVDSNWRGINDKSAQ